MKNRLIVFLVLLLPFTAMAQPGEKAKKKFLAELNGILKNSKENDHWNQPGIMSIDSPFAINTQGILSVTVRFKDEDGEVVRARMQAPVEKIVDVAYDLYLILDYKTDMVIKYESEINSEPLVEKYKTKYFHIGAPLSDGRKQQKKLQGLLGKLLKYYPTEKNRDAE